MTSDVPRIRLRIIGVVAFSLFVALISRLWFLQVMNSEAYEERALENTEREVRIPAPRGRIFDAKGNLLVDNKVVTVVSIDKAQLQRALPDSPSKAQARRDMLTRLAVEISKSGQLIKVADIETSLRNSQYAQLGEVPIALDVSKDLVVLIGEHPEQFPGVKISQTTVRDYRYGNLAAHLLGYVGRINDAEYRERADSVKDYDRNDQIGKTGVERLFEDELRGVPGTRVYEVDRNERVIREVTEKNRDPIPGYDLRLTIDIDLQGMVETELRLALEQARLQPKRSTDDPPVLAPAGAAVIVDPRNGSVLAMASYPTFDPAEFISGISATRYAYLNDPANFSPILNRVTQGEYAPGSTFKLFTSYAALKGGFMGKGTLPGVSQRVNDSGVFQLKPCDGGKCEWTNARNAQGDPLRYSNIDLRTSLTVSSDTYYYAIGAEIARSRGNDRAIQDAAEAFGLGSPTGITLPGERAGRIPDADLKKSLHEKYPTAFPYSQWFVGDNINLAVGQGDTLVTPIQLADAYAALANGGKLYAPNVVAQVRDAQGNLVNEIGARQMGTVDLPPEVRDPILDGLIGVTASAEPAGTAYTAFHSANGANFDLTRWPVAAKTGTAQVAGKADTAVFTAVGPVAIPGDPTTAANVPAYSMAVVLEQSGFGGQNAAPVVAKVFDAIVDNRVPHAYSTSELLTCFGLQNPESAASSSTTTSTTTTTARAGAKATTTTKPPAKTTAVLPSGVSCP